MLYNFVFLALSALASVSRGQECIRNAAMELATCNGRLNRIGSDGARNDVCREGRRAIICMQRVLENCPPLKVHMTGQMVMIQNSLNQKCPDVPTEAPETEVPEIEVPETDVPETDVPETEAPETDVPETEAPETDVPETVASETDTLATDPAPRSRCSPDDVNRIARCASRLQRFVGRSNIKCHKVRRTLNCLSKTLQRCPHMLDDRHDHIGTLRRYLLQVCVEANELPEEPQIGETGEEEEEEEEEGEEEEEDVCPADFMLRIQRCVEDMGNAMRNIGSGTEDAAESCSSVTASLDCLEDYARVCRGRPEMAQMTRMLNIDRTRSYVARICPGAGTGAGPTGGPDEGPTGGPEAGPTGEPDEGPTGSPDAGPTGGPDEGPAGGPEAGPTGEPDEGPTGSPDAGPTGGPDEGPGTGPNEGDSECPADYEDRIQTCVKALEKLNPQVVNVEVCGSANVALGCVDDVLNDCKHTPHVQAFKTVLNMDGLRTMVNDICTSGTVPPGQGVDANCPSDHSRQLISCVQPMQTIKQNPNKNLSEMCRVANTGFNCLDDIMSKCPNQPDVMAMSRIMHLDNLREMINGHCSNAVPDVGPDEGPVEVTTTNSNSGDTCNVADPADELLVCNSQLQKFSSSSSSLSTRCRDMFKGLDCFDRLIASCPRHPSVVTFTDMLDMGEVRENLSGACPGRK